MSRSSSSRGKEVSEIQGKHRVARHQLLQHPALQNHPALQSPPVSPENPPSPHSGLFNQLQHLIPRHALFHVCITVHQISSVPLVSGEFAVRWKIKNTRKRSAVLSPSKPGIFAGLKGKGKGKEHHARGSVELVNIMADHFGVKPPRPGPAVRSSSSTTTASSTSIPTSSSSSSSIQSWPSITPFLPLKEHGVTWEQTLHTTVKLAISRSASTSSTETDVATSGNLGTLVSSLFKLVVVQKVTPGDPKSPRNPRVGAIYLDLAEYAGVEGETTRRYLLRESKTNATLKVTIALSHVGGETNYIAPPLPKGEILNGVLGLLDNDVYKTRPRAMDYFGPYYEYHQAQREKQQARALQDDDDDDDDDDGFFASREDLTRHKNHHRAHSYESPIAAAPRPKVGKRHKAHQQLVLPTSTLSPILASPRSAWPNSSHSSHSSHAPSPAASPSPYDLSHLPFAAGPKTTETLIEAIFNPVPITAMPRSLANRERLLGQVPVDSNPFVYFVPRQDADLTIGRSTSRNVAPRPKTPKLTEEVASMMSTSTSSASLSSGKSASGTGSSSGNASSSHHRPELSSSSGGSWLRRNNKQIVAISDPPRRLPLNERIESVVGVVI
ncbi:hypothetical protein C8J56DRAFT_935836 [Mycena floridula]|nr:hypothetical protein C8J56DRAFT_935836 [Mycena floridula]